VVSCIHRAPPPPSPRLFVGNLDRGKVNDGVLIKLFSVYGKIVREQIMRHQAGALRGQPRGYAFVEYSTTEEAAAAIEALDSR
jgi:RNA-binding protein 18